MPFATDGGSGTVTVSRAVWSDSGEMAPPQGQRYLSLDVTVTATSGEVPVDAILFLAETSDGPTLPGFGPDLDRPLGGRLLRAGQEVSGQLGYVLAPGPVRGSCGGRDAPGGGRDRDPGPVSGSFRNRRFRATAPEDRPRRSRSASRVIVTDGDAVLLFADTDPGIPGSGWWVTPGGGIDPGETPRAAAVREVAEETGLVIEPERLVGPVAVRTVVHGYSDQVLSQHESFFVLAVDAPFEIVPDGWTADEQTHSRRLGLAPAGHARRTASAGVAGRISPNSSPSPDAATPGRSTSVGSRSRPCR